MVDIFNHFHVVTATDISVILHSVIVVVKMSSSIALQYLAEVTN